MRINILINGFIKRRESFANCIDNSSILFSSRSRFLTLALTISDLPENPRNFCSLSSSWIIFSFSEMLMIGNVFINYVFDNICFLQVMMISLIIHPSIIFIDVSISLILKFLKFNATLSARNMTM